MSGMPQMAPIRAHDSMAPDLTFDSLRQVRSWAASHPDVLDGLLGEALKREGAAAAEFWPGCAWPSFTGGFSDDGRMLVCFPIHRHASISASLLFDCGAGAGLSPQTA